jgi:hypothetical protein
MTEVEVEVILEVLADMTMTVIVAMKKELKSATTILPASAAN